MKLPLSVFIGLRYAKASKDGKVLGFVSLFSIAGIALGVMALILVVSVMDGFEGILKKRILSAVPHIVIKYDQNQVSTEYITKTLTTLERKQHITQVLPLIESQAIVQLPGALKGVMAQGLVDENNVPAAVSEQMLIGSWPQFFNYNYGVVMGQYLASEYGVTIGDRVKLMVSGASHYTPLGRIPAQRNFTVVGVYSTESEIDQQLIFTRARDLNKLLKKPVDSQAGVRLVLDDPFLSQQIISELNQLLADKPVTLTDWRESHGKLFDAVKMEKTMMWLMLSLIVAVAAFNIVSALVMMVTKKQSEIAILKTIGMNPSQIRRIFTFQGAYNGILGTVIGGLLGGLLCFAIAYITQSTGSGMLGLPELALPMAFNPIKFLVIVVFALLLALVASIYPAKKAAMLKPADVLRYQ